MSQWAVNFKKLTDHWLILGDDHLDNLTTHPELDNNRDSQNLLEFSWDLHHLWQLDTPPVGTLVSRWHVVFNWGEDIVDLDKLGGGDNKAKGGWGLGDKGDPM